jgi:drug/metabolite transporter (DMT)-like permease
MLFKIIISYATLYIVWGSTYYFIKLAVTTIPPMYVVAFRFLVGGLGLIGYTLLINRKNIKNVIPTGNQILFSSIIGILLLIGGNGMVTVGEMKVDSYIAALLISTVPIVVLVFDRFILKKKILPVSLFGAGIGVAGTWLLLCNGQTFLPSLNPFVLFLFAAAVSWAFGTTLSKKVSLPGDVIMNTGVQSLTAGLVSFIAWNFVQPVTTLSLSTISPQSWFSLAYLTVIGSVAFCAYSFLLKHEPNHRVVTYSLVNPVIAVLLGVFIGQEKTVPFLVPSCFLIVAGLFFLFYGEKIMIMLKKQ